MKVAFGFVSFKGIMDYFGVFKLSAHQWFCVALAFFFTFPHLQLRQV